MHQANVITDNKVTTEGPGTRGKYYISLLFLHSWLCPPSTFFLMIAGLYFDGRGD
jgi:hypothetical protein